ncbi:MAG: hypothetical protein ABI680_00390, partial [Chthoniobacteraceae bacterium]
FLAYEALHTFPFESLRAAIDFLEISASDEVLRGAIEANAFERSRAQVAGRGGGGPILRKGQIGSGAVELPKGVAEQMSVAGEALYREAAGLAAVPSRVASP